MRSAVKTPLCNVCRDPRVVRVVTFDIWGTLLDLPKFYLIVSRNVSTITGKPGDEIYRAMLRAYREALKVRLHGGFNRIVVDSAEFFSSKLGVSSEVLFQGVVAALDDTEISELSFLDAREALTSTRASGYVVAALGNVMFWPGMVTRYILHRNGLLRFFDITVFSDEVGLQKPSREIFEYVTRKVGTDLDSLVHVGDSPENDLAGALTAGARAVLVNRSSPLRVVQLGRNAYLVNDLRNLPEVLMKIWEEAY